MLPRPLLLAWLLQSWPALAAPADHGDDTVGLTRGCVHSPDSRSCWTDGFDISTNYYGEVPDTGVGREYWLEVGKMAASPDGVPRIVQAFNGTVPGPTIWADWGDTVGGS